MKLEDITLLWGRGQAGIGSVGDYPPRVIMFDSILVVEKQKHDPNKTSLLVLGIIVGCLGVLGLSIAASGGMGVNFGLK
jgi:hypothetical protein